MLCPRTNRYTQFWGYRTYAAYKTLSLLVYFNRDSELTMTSTFKVLGPYESPYAGLMMLKLNTSTGDTWVTTGPLGESVKAWREALEKIYWIPVVKPKDLDTFNTSSTDRYQISGPIAFGDTDPNAAQERKKHAAFLIDSFTGKTYLWATTVEGKETLPFHDKFENTFWKPMEESGSLPRFSFGNPPYVLQPLINADKMAIGGSFLGPALVRVEVKSGVSWIGKWVGNEDTNMRWERVKESTERE